jgi:hypothetical protein
MSAMGRVDPITYPQAWDVVEISGIPTPGIAQVPEWKRQHDFDVKKGKGTLGATVTFVQKPPAEGSIKFLLWTPSHFAQWDAFLPYLKYDPTKKTVSAVDIWHPSLDAIDVHSVVTTKIGNPIHDGDGMWSISIDFLEYFPPSNKSAVSTPQGAAQSQPGAGALSRTDGQTDSVGVPPIDAQDAYMQEIQKDLGLAQAP